ncbi:CLIP domain-containing serine protease B4-like [Ochlerotatus camptorhynchus]|uniref:CLIP domain-containing serine protease B4-like n=1 Tax=Ochlerotatus camptorhynchus TaxID=644619 RepID=UPI0031CE435E
MVSSTLFVLLLCTTVALSKPAADEASPNDDGASLPKPGVCGVSLADRIVGGRRTAINAYPWASLLMAESKQGGRTVPFCGASLISDRFVLSAAHCFPGASENYIISNIRLGEWDILSKNDCEDEHCSDNPIDAPVESIEIHKEYSGEPDFHNDIALVKLATPVTFTEFISPVCLPSAEKLRTKSETGRKFTAVGWGDIKYDAKTRDVSIGNRYKFEVQLPGVEPATCRASYPNLWDSEMCAGKTGKDTCQGDSGGPLSIAENDGYWYQHGVVSYGYGCGFRNYPGVYTRVTHFIPWIKEHMKKMSRTSSAPVSTTTQRTTFSSQYEYIIHILNNIYVD